MRQTGLLIFIDFQKAFDTLEWSYRYKCIKAFNFGVEFMRWIRILSKHTILIIFVIYM